MSQKFPFLLRNAQIRGMFRWGKKRCPLIGKQIRLIGRSRIFIRLHRFYFNYFRKAKGIKIDERFAD